MNLALLYWKVRAVQLRIGFYLRICLTDSLFLEILLAFAKCLLQFLCLPSPDVLFKTLKHSIMENPLDKGSKNCILVPILLQTSYVILGESLTLGFFIWTRRTCTSWPLKFLSVLKLKTT